MPRVTGADLTNVSTKNEPLPADVYTCVIREANIEGDSNSPQVVVVSEVDMPGTDFHKRRIWDRIYLNKKDGTPNEFSMKQLKRYFEAVVGEEAANQAEPDTDDLINGKVQLKLAIRGYKPKVNGVVDESAEEKFVNEVKQILPAA